MFIQGESVGILQLADADAVTCGSKAAACGRLASLAAASDKGNFWVSSRKILCFDIYDINWPHDSSFFNLLKHCNFYSVFRNPFC